MFFESWRSSPISLKQAWQNFFLHCTWRVCRTCLTYNIPLIPHWYSPKALNGCLFPLLNEINEIPLLNEINEIILSSFNSNVKRRVLTHGFRTTVRLIKKETTFILILHSLNSTNWIVIHELFKELQKIDNLPLVPSNLIDSFGFYVKMKTNVSKPKWENNRFFFHSL